MTHHDGFNLGAYSEIHPGPVLAKLNCEGNRERGQGLSSILEWQWVGLDPEAGIFVSLKGYKERPP